VKEHGFERAIDKILDECTMQGHGQLKAMPATGAWSKNPKIGLTIGIESTMLPESTH